MDLSTVAHKARMNFIHNSYGKEPTHIVVNEIAWQTMVNELSVVRRAGFTPKEFFGMRVIRSSDVEKDEVFCFVKY